MSRITAVFGGERKVLAPYITAGFPDAESTVPVLHALVEAGADLIELGMPFSDPMADGPVIQKACLQAIKGGADLGTTLAAVMTFRERDEKTPIVLMGYLNPIERYGVERFCKGAANAGVDGVLIVDAPLEETESVELLGKYGLDRILLAAPTTPLERVGRIAAAGSGFLYYVSFTGITGAASLAADTVSDAIAKLRDHCKLPIAVGFGIKTPADATALRAADGVVIGSALITHIVESAGDPADAARSFLAPFRQALDSD